jgi:AraC family transcriptional regulator
VADCHYNRHIAAGGARRIATAALDSLIFTVDETHGRVHRPGNELLLHSEDVGWSSLHAAVFREAPFQAKEPPIGHPSLIYHISNPTRVTRQIDGAQVEKALIGPRRFSLTPGESSTQWQHAGNPEILQVYLRKSTYQAAIEEMFGMDGAAAEVVPRFATIDPLLEQLALAILAALRDGSSQDRLYVETMAQMIAVHLARKHSSRSRPEKIVAGDGLSRQRIQRLLEYIEANLGGDLSLETMAAEIEMSPFYLSRVFKASLGQSPHRYVLERRVERAKQMLRDSDTPVADVALTSGFSSQSHLSNWFHRLVGTSPAAYRREN